MPSASTDRDSPLSIEGRALEISADVARFLELPPSTDARHSRQTLDRVDGRCRRKAPAHLAAFRERRRQST
jgi:hypothetical protein